MENFEKYALIIQAVKNFHELANAEGDTDFKSTAALINDAILSAYMDLDIPEHKELFEADIALIFWIILRGGNK